MSGVNLKCLMENMTVLGMEEVAECEGHLAVHGLVCRPHAL